MWPAGPPFIDTMSRPEPHEVKQVGIVGTGVIGSAWAALFVARGLRVSVYVRSAASEAKFRDGLADAHAKLVARGLAPAGDAAAARLSSSAVVVVPTIAAAVAAADYVQESVVEALELKQKVVAEIDRHAPPGVLIGTSRWLVMTRRIQNCLSLPARSRLKRLAVLKFRNPYVTRHATCPSWHRQSLLPAFTTRE
jgi:carnitine 3-dehydrogenase